MAYFRCKMCGGSLEIGEKQSVVTCDYCGTQQTLPKLDDDRRASMYDRANHFRRNNEFDKAMGVYEQILNEDNTDAEAYWSLVLCRYGIEYVEDPNSHQRIPTVNRAQFTSIFDDENYQSALQYSDSLQRIIYEAEAKAINEIQKGILEISQKEVPFDVFICYKESDNRGQRTVDSVLAQDIYEQLTNRNLKVFFARITLEDKLGVAYEPYIFAALNSAKVMLVLGTKADYFNAVWVKNEWSRYLALVNQSRGDKVLIPLYKDMDPYNLPKEFSHLQAQDMNKIGFMQDLVRGVKKVVGDNPNVATLTTAALLERMRMFLEDKSWDNADEYAEKVLDIDPKNADAYIGKLLAELNLKNQAALADLSDSFENNKNYKKAIRYADEDLLAELKRYIVTINERNAEKARIEKERREEQNRKEEERARIRAEMKYQRTKKCKKIIKIASICTVFVILISVFVIRPIITYHQGNYQVYIDMFQIKEFTIPDGVTAIEPSAFADCDSLTSVIIPDSVTSIGERAFKDCDALTNISISNSVTSIGKDAFVNCRSLTNISIPDSVTHIGEGAFSFCTSLASITIPDSVTHIGERAFFYCTSLASITIPNTLKTIGLYSVFNCSSLTRINFGGTVSQWNAMNKPSNWDENTGNYIIYCSDGGIRKDGTVYNYK